MIKDLITILLYMAKYLIIKLIAVLFKILLKALTYIQTLIRIIFCFDIFRVLIRMNQYLSDEINFLNSEHQEILQISNNTEIHIFNSEIEQIPTQTCESADHIKVQNTMLIEGK
jgi:hypothetical protein